jgi:hypothetical protein
VSEEEQKTSTEATSKEEKNEGWFEMLPESHIGHRTSVIHTRHCHKIGRYSRSVTQASICPRFYKQFDINPG